jgi:hypothetical protein
MRLNRRKNYRLKVVDEVYTPIFDYPQWTIDDYDVEVKLTMHSDQLGNITDPKLIALSIFK